jgi:hypothetical protein
MKKYLIRIKANPLVLLINFVSFSMVLVTIGLLPYAAKSIYIPATKNYTVSYMVVLNKYEVQADLKIPKHNNDISITYSTVTDGANELRVPTSVWNDCKYGDVIKYYVYDGSINQYSKLKIYNGILIIFMFVVPLSWILFGLMEVGKCKSKDVQKANEPKTIAKVIIGVIWDTVMVGIVLFFIIQSYLIMNQFIF